jgi:hypothetical protein
MTALERALIGTAAGILAWLGLLAIGILAAVSGRWS